MKTANEYLVTGMTCGHCEGSVGEEVRSVAGVQAVSMVPRPEGSRCQGTRSMTPPY